MLTTVLKSGGASVASISAKGEVVPSSPKPDVAVVDPGSMAGSEGKPSVSGRAAAAAAAVAGGTCVSPEFFQELVVPARGQTCPSTCCAGSSRESSPKRAVVLRSLPAPHPARMRGRRRTGRRTMNPRRRPRKSRGQGLRRPRLRRPRLRRRNPRGRRHRGPNGPPQSIAPHQSSGSVVECSRRATEDHTEAGVKRAKCEQERETRHGRDEVIGVMIRAIVPNRAVRSP